MHYDRNKIEKAMKDSFLIPFILFMVFSSLFITNCRKKCCNNPINPPVPIALTTDSVIDITHATATSGGTITSNGGDTITSRGICWSKAQSPTITDSITSDSIRIGHFTSSIIGLISNTTYYVRAYVINSGGTAYGNEQTFTTLRPFQCGDQITYSNQIYNTVQVGTQCWMRENLNIGTRISGIQEQINNNNIEKYCYYDLSTNCDEYRGLYQWGELVDYVNSASNTTSWDPIPTGNVQGICPPGWHIHTDYEWTIITTYLGGEIIAGGKLKEIDTYIGNLLIQERPMKAVSQDFPVAFAILMDYSLVLVNSVPGGVPARLMIALTTHGGETYDTFLQMYLEVSGISQLAFLFVALKTERPNVRNTFQSHHSSTSVTVL